MNQKLAMRPVRETIAPSRSGSVASLSIAKPAAQFGVLMCLIGALFYFYEFLLRVSPSVMTADLSSAYHLEAAKLGGLSSCYYLAYAPMQFFVGMLMDRYGPRILLIGATLCCALGTYLFACSHAIALAEVGRFVVGFGSAFAFVGVLKLATLWLPPSRFAIVSGLTTALGMIGGLVGQRVLSMLVQSVGWQTACYLSAVAGIPLFLLMVYYLKDGFDRRGNAQPNQAKDLRDTFSGLSHVVRNPQIWLVGAIGCLIYMPTDAFAELWAVPFFEQVYHFSSTEAAGVVSYIFAGWAFGGLFVGWLSNRLGLRRLPISIGASIASVLLAVVLFLPGMSANLVALTLFVFGVFSSAQVLIFAIGHEVTPSRSVGTAVAMINMMVMLGGFAQKLIGQMLDATWLGNVANGARLYSTLHWQQALSILPLCLMLSVLLSMMLNETRGVARHAG